MSSTTEDLTTRARIRDAAIHRFAAHGMDASLRAVAADAGVSAGLILHHFGSRAGLRAACDEHVFTQVREFKSASLDARTGPASMLAQIAEIDGFTDLIGYVLRVLQVGGAPTRAFIDSLVATNASYIDDAVRDGVVRPSRDPAAGPAGGRRAARPRAPARPAARLRGAPHAAAARALHRAGVHHPGAARRLPRLARHPRRRRARRRHAHRRPRP